MLPTPLCGPSQSSTLSFLVNHMPDPRTGLSPSDVFAKTRWEQSKFADVHVWGCPVYVLDKMISDGKKLPRWSPRSTRTINLGFSDKHASSVPLVALNPQTGYITPQFRIVFDDWFATVSASADDLPNFNDASWHRMFKDSTYQYILDDEDEERLIVEATDYEQAQDLLSRMQRVSTAIEASTPPQVLPVAPPPLATPLQPPREQVSTPVPAAAPLPPTTPLLTPREATPQAPAPIDDTRLPTPTPIRLFQAPPTPNQPVNEGVLEASELTIVPKATKAKSTPVKHEPRRSTRNRSAPLRLGYDGQQGHGYNAELDGTSLEWLFNEVAECPSPPPSSYKASASDPDTLSFIEAMNDIENFEKWMNAANDEIQSLEKNGTWKEVSISEAKTRILPGTWVFRRKRTPDGTISKYKARYCVRGDLQEVIQDTFAPVVAWSRAAHNSIVIVLSDIEYTIQYIAILQMDNTIYCNTLIQQYNILQYFRRTIQYIAILKTANTIYCNTFKQQYIVLLTIYCNILQYIVTRRIQCTVILL